MSDRFVNGLLAMLGLSGGLVLALVVLMLDPAELGSRMAFFLCLFLAAFGLLGLAGQSALTPGGRSSAQAMRRGAVWAFVLLAAAMLQAERALNLVNGLLLLAILGAGEVFARWRR